MRQCEVLLDIIHWKGHISLFGILLPKMQILNLIIRKPQNKQTHTIRDSLQSGPNSSNMSRSGKIMEDFSKLKTSKYKWLIIVICDFALNVGPGISIYIILL